MASKPLATSPLNSRRAEICRTAARIIRQRGFDATSVNDIARALKMTKAGPITASPAKRSCSSRSCCSASTTFETRSSSRPQSIRDPEERLRQIVMRRANHDAGRGSVAQIDEIRALPTVRAEASPRDAAQSISSSCAKRCAS